MCCIVGSSVKERMITMKHIKSENEKKADALVKFIDSNITFIGRRPFVVAVWKTADLFEVKNPDEINFTKDVYPAVAAEIHRNLIAAERAIYRAADYCWRKGSNEYLNKIIGRDLPVKPKPSEMLLYCAYYMIYKIPYREASKKPSLPLPF